jgi:proteasome accessory factor C
MSATDRVARMLTLIPWLLERPGATLDETAAAFGVDQPTVRRDLEHLDYCGLPGLGGGDLFEVTIVGDRISVRMADELRRPLRLTPREALRLVLTVEAVADAFGADVPALTTALAKVREAARVPPGVAVELGADGEQWLKPLRTAAADGRQVRLTYRSRRAPTPAPRTVDPWQLHLVDGAWYLHGHDHAAGAHRTFRLDRIADVAILDDAVTATAPPADELPAPTYVRGEHDVEVTVETTARGRWLADAVRPDVVTERDDGGVRITLHTDAPAWLVELVLMAGGDAYIAAPSELAADVAARARAALELYQPSDPVEDTGGH